MVTLPLINLYNLGLFILSDLYFQLHCVCLCVLQTPYEIPVFGEIKLILNFKPGRNFLSQLLQIF